jgi:lon-related putative ATP-dependent protease
MPLKKLNRKPLELKGKQLEYTVDYKPAGVKSSEQIKPCEVIIGQERAVESLKLGLDVKSVGYNIFVTGQAGTGRTTTIKVLLEQLNRAQPNLSDFCYVNNFKNEDSPRLLVFNVGDGRRFKKDMNYLIGSIRKAVPKIFMSEDYKDRHSRVSREFEQRQKELISGFEKRLTDAGFVMVQIQQGLSVRNEIHPLVKGEPVSLEQLEEQVAAGEFAMTKLDELRRKWDRLRRDFDNTTVESKKLSTKLEDALEKLDQSILTPFIHEKVNVLKKRYNDEDVIQYLDEVAEALVADLDRFREAQPRRGEEEAPPYRKREPFEEFSVNLILDNSETSEVPIVVENSPTYKNLFGSLERVVDRFGYWRTDFTRIFAGSLLSANGGYLIINAVDLFTEPGIWQQLKRTLRTRQLEIAGYDPFYMMAGAGIKPEAIPLDLKVVIIGEPRVYSMLWHYDEDFKKIFKIKAEFDTSMDASAKNIKRYFEFVRKVIDHEKLRPFDLSGMQAVAEYGKRVAGHRKKLTARFTAVSDIIREAAYCARQRRAKMVQRRDVHCAVAQHRHRVNLVEDKIQEMYDNEMLLISITGMAVGQINGLSVYNLGDYAFGRPTRITVNTSLGKAGVINIERESDLSGPIHNKGVLVLGGYLRQTFAQDKPLAMSASISFEQSYSGVDGDSASSTEIYAIMSSIANIPLKQSIAVTGSVNQKGEIQPIGGVNEKIEGFYDVCKSRRLSGSQGVIIPHQNVQDLLLRPDVADAVRGGKFHVYPVKTIEQGIEILTGFQAGKRNKNGKFTPNSVFDAVDKKLLEMAHTIQNFGMMNNNDKNSMTSRRKRRNKKKS